jgi:large subunit ribosomal protein L25
MSQKITLAAEPRSAARKQNRQLRLSGKTPVVVYGRHTEAVSLQVDTRELVKVLSQAGGTQLITLKVDGEKVPRVALTKAVQRHVTRLTPLHVDFIEVQMDEPVTIAMLVVFDGEPELVRSGDAMLDVVVDRVNVSALPGDLPETLHVDVSGLPDMHAAIRAGDLPLGDKVRLMDDPELLLVHLSSTAAAAAAAAAMEAAAEAATGAGPEEAEEPEAQPDEAEAE